MSTRIVVDIWGIPVITGGDQSWTFFMTLTVLRRFYNELEGVVHDKEFLRAMEGRRELL